MFPGGTQVVSGNAGRLPIVHEQFVQGGCRGCASTRINKMKL